MAGPLPESIQLSIVIPVLNEAETLDTCLTRLVAHPVNRNRCEIIVCDGGSHDATVAIAAGRPCRVIRCPPGRAVQMNAGSEAARGEYLLFLHADSVLPPDFSLADIAPASWGFFRLHLDDHGLVYRVIETAINLRTRFTRVAGGDQGLYFERDLFASLGGFPRIPLMEDIAICKLARRIRKPAIIRPALTSSTRRWREHGVVSTVLLMWWLRFAYWLGADPRRLHRIYYPGRSGPCND